MGLGRVVSFQTGDDGLNGSRIHISLARNTTMRRSFCFRTAQLVRFDPRKPNAIHPDFPMGFRYCLVGNYPNARLLSSPREDWSFLCCFVFADATAGVIRDSGWVTAYSKSILQPFTAGARRQVGRNPKVGSTIGWWSYSLNCLIHQKVSAVPLGISLAPWVKAIRESAIRRRVMQGAHTLSELAATDDFEKLAHDVEHLKSLIEARRETETDGSLETIEREYAEYVRNLDALSIRFGIRELDERTGGFQLGEVVTLIARTGVGKSAVAQNVISNVLARYPDSGVAFFSHEMPKFQAFERQWQIHAGRRRGDVILAYRTGNKSVLGTSDLVRQFNEQLAIFDTAGLSLLEIERRVSALGALKRLKPVRLVVIDYLGYLGGGPRNAELVERTSELARGMKRLAKDLGAVILLIAQTSRSAGDGSEEVTVTDTREFTGTVGERATRHPILPIDRVLLPSEQRTRV